MHHAVAAFGVAGFVAVARPVGRLDQLLERLAVAFLQEVAGPLPAEDVVGGVAPRRAFVVHAALEEFDEVGREVELPGFFAVFEDFAEELFRLFAFQKVLLIRGFLVGVARRDHHALDAEGHDFIEEFRDFFRLGTVEECGVGGDSEAALDGFFDGINRDVVGAIAAHGHVVLLLRAIEVDGEGEVFAGLEEIEFAFEEERVGAEVYVFFHLHQALDDLVNLLVDKRLATGDRDHGCAAFLGRGPALLRGEAFVEDVVGVLDFAAAGAGEVAAEERLEHEHEGIVFVAAELLVDDITCHRPHLGDRN